MLTITETKWTPRGQGDAGEASAICWVLSRGGCAFVPAGHTPSDYDLLVDFGEEVLKVQVKTSTMFRKGRFEVMLATRGGNQSWNGTIKYLDASRCDYVFVHVGDGRRWFIPTSALDGGSHALVGGPKYAKYEIEPAQPLMSRSGSTDYTR
jgi:hypothetical protein